MNIVSRKLCIVSLSFLAGVFLYRESLVLSLIALAASIVLVIVLKRNAAIAVIAAVAFLSGGFYTLYVDGVRTERAKKYSGIENTFSGKVVSLPNDGESGQSAIIKTEGLKLQLTSSGEVFSYGDIVEFSTEAYIPNGKSSDADFNYPMYLKTKGIYLCGFATDTKVLKSGIRLYNPIDLCNILRAGLLKRTAVLWSGDTLMFERAILLGSNDIASDSFRETLAAGGISHIIAVSGMHVGLACSLVLFLLERVSQRRRALKLLAVLFIAFFVLLTGCAVSSMRAAVMLSLYILAEYLLRPYDGYTSLALAAFLITLVNPFLAFSLSFLLSFSAVLGIITFYRPFLRFMKFVRPMLLREILCVTASAQVFVFPVLAFSFGRVPVLCLLTNIIAVPLVPFIMIIGYMAVLLVPMCMPLADFIADAADTLVSLCLKTADIFGHIPGSNVYITYSSKGIFVLAWIAFTAFLYFAFVKKNKIASLILLNTGLMFTFLCCALPIFSGNDASVCFLDAGAGDCTVAISGNNSVVIDCTSRDNDFAKDEMLPFMRQNGVSALDVMALTDYNENNKNLEYILENFKVGTLVIPEGEMAVGISELAKRHGTELIRTRNGDSFSVGDIRLETLYSGESDAYLLTVRETDMLITGKLTPGEERELSRVSDKCEVLKAPNHGYSDSCTSELITVTDPETVIVSTNREPSEKVLKRLSGRKLYTTRDCGAVKLIAESGEIIPYRSAK